MHAARALGLALVLAAPALLLVPSAEPLPVDLHTGPELSHGWAYLTADMAALAMLHPDKAKWYSTGKSVLGLDVWVLEVGNFAAQDGSEPSVVIDGGHHGNEPMGVEMVWAVAVRLLNDYASNATLRGIVDNTRIYLVPSVNPDGNTLDTRKNARLVDVNRNYPFHWGGPGCSMSLLSATYCGPSAGSEPEVQAMMALLTRADPDLYLSGHTGTVKFLSAWGYTTAPPPDDELYDNVNEAFQQRTTITSGQGSTTLYIASGTSKDWAYGVLGSLSWTLEVDNEQYVPLSISDVEFRLRRPLGGVYWLLENVERLGARVLPGAPGATAQGDGAYRVAFALPNDGFGPAAVTATLRLEGAPVALEGPATQVVQVPALGQGSVAFTLRPVGEGAGGAVLELGYAKTLHLGEPAQAVQRYDVRVAGGALTVALPGA